MPNGRTKAGAKKAASRRRPAKRRASSMPDPVALEVFSNALLSVAEEMGAALIRTAYSTNIKERQDASTAIFDAEGRLIAQAEHIPMHLGAMLSIIRNILKRYPLEELSPATPFWRTTPTTAAEPISPTSPSLLRCSTAKGSSASSRTWATGRTWAASSRAPR